MINEKLFSFKKIFIIEFGMAFLLSLFSAIARVCFYYSTKGLQ